MPNRSASLASHLRWCKSFCSDSRFRFDFGFLSFFVFFFCYRVGQFKKTSTQERIYPLCPWSHLKESFRTDHPVGGSTRILEKGHEWCRDVLRSSCVQFYIHTYFVIGICLWSRGRRGCPGGQIYFSGQSCFERHLGSRNRRARQVCPQPG